MTKEKTTVKAKLETEGMRNVILNALPQNITNGDVIMTMFPNADKHFYDDILVCIAKGYPDQCSLRANHIWWNAPYKTESEE